MTQEAVANQYRSNIEVADIGGGLHLNRAEQARTDLLTVMKSEYGQFFTPESLAKVVVDGLKLPEVGVLKVLDLGAGAGALSAALLDRVSDKVRLEITAVEVDSDLVDSLKHTLEGVDVKIVNADAIELAYSGELGQDFDVVVMNPPYGKIAVSSTERRMMSAMGVEVPNIYAAFMAIGYMALKPGGQIAAIVPRSWANGPYFKKFRRHMTQRLGIDRIHAFSSRSSLFSEANVLQENIILTGTAGTQDEYVDVIFDMEPTRSVSIGAVIVPDDPEMFVRIPTGAERELPGQPLSVLGLKVSTGKVVDFRCREYLQEAHTGLYPLIYQGNIFQGQITWPRSFGKPQSFTCPPDDVDRYLLPAGNYVVVKRFSAKEEKRRIVAAAHHSKTPVAYDNKTNIIPCPDQQTAVGLAMWLNSTAVDNYFRSFSGHTQVNATDLRVLPYPSLGQLKSLGEGRPVVMPGQDEIDEAVEVLL